MPWKPNHEEASVSLSIRDASGVKTSLTDGELSPGTYTVVASLESHREDLPADAYIAVLFVWGLTDNEGNMIGDLESKDTGSLIGKGTEFNVTEFTIPDEGEAIMWTAYAHAGTPESNMFDFGAWGKYSLRILRD